MSHWAVSHRPEMMGSSKLPGGCVPSVARRPGPCWASSFLGRSGEPPVNPVVESAAYTGVGGSAEACGEARKAWIASAAKRREAATRAAGEVARMPSLAMSTRIRSSGTVAIGYVRHRNQEAADPVVA